MPWSQERAAHRWRARVAHVEDAVPHGLKLNTGLPLLHREAPCGFPVQGVNGLRHWRPVTRIRGGRRSVAATLLTRGATPMRCGSRAGGCSGSQSPSPSGGEDSLSANWPTAPSQRGRPASRVRSARSHCRGRDPKAPATPPAPGRSEPRPRRRVGGLAKAGVASVSRRSPSPSPPASRETTPLRRDAANLEPPATTLRPRCPERGVAPRLALSRPVATPASSTAIRLPLIRHSPRPAPGRDWRFAATPDR